MAQQSSSFKSWNTHVHLFNPALYPYSANRSYTPPAATASTLFATSRANNFLIVQATIENDSAGVIGELQRLRTAEPHRIIRGVILNDGSSAEVRHLAATVESAHAAGVRCIRIHGHFDASQSLSSSKITTILGGSMAGIAHQYNWCISLRLPITTWAAMRSYLETRSVNPKIIAEHCGVFDWPLTEEGGAAMADFLALLRQGLIYVKLGALHRRVRSGHHIGELKPVIAAMASAGPKQLLWGSDWPHVNAAVKGLKESPFLNVDDDEELDVLRTSMSHQCFTDMLNTTPNSLLY